MERPIRIAIFDKNKKGNGLKLISLVNRPAIGFMAVKMSEQQQFQLSIQDDEQRIIFTPVLIPNQFIYRNINGNEFDLMFDAPTIKEIAIDWAKKQLNQNADIEHSEKLIDGVVWFESFILDEKRAKVANGFDSIPFGTWFVSGYVENNDVWQKIKSGEIKGVSIDGIFDAMQIQQNEHIELLDDDYEFVINNILNNL